ncbi:SET and MYND domain-containing protein 4-like [Chelonus insularis]|uniref:SET and MYND domain-containing protein 4-like n=1 Tax=Chelonus insularis TaxID=460826 RepID=UPI00158CD724|nr:SET and MYND domain-containing protein 4-like [Chelonus insularis]
MANSKRITIGQFINSLNHLTNDSAFMKEFNQHSSVSDRHGMIEMIMQRQETLDFKIKILFSEKDNTKARKLFENARKTNEKLDKIASFISKINLLNEALSAVTINSELLIEIILARAKLWLHMEFYTKCNKDCDYAIETLNSEESKNYQNKEKYKTEFNELKIKALKLMYKRNDRTVKNIIESPLNIPEVDGKRNKKLTSSSDAVAMVYSPLKGRHLVATKNIKAGSVLIVDEPFAFSTDQQALSTNCLHCHLSLRLDEQILIPCINCQTVAFCSTKCRKEAWNNYHKYECSIFDNFFEKSKSDQRSHLLLAYRATVAIAVDKQSAALNEEFFKYQKKQSQENESLMFNINTDIYDPLDYKTVYSLETHCDKASVKINFLRSVKAVFLAKSLNYVVTENKDQQDDKKIIGEDEVCLLAVGMLRHMQAIDCNAYEIVENIRDEASKTWEPRNVGGAIYTTVSLVNHSCYPNVIRHSYPRGKVVVRALRFIEKGTEILDCYGPHFITDDFPTRQKYLQNKYHFTCVCDPCKFNWKLSMSTDPQLRCTACGSPVNSVKPRCQLPTCSRKIDIRKQNDQLTKSIKKRMAAIGKMYDGYYLQALPLLLEHASVIDKILIAPNIESIKTQQSIIQCYNSMGNVSKQFVKSITLKNEM